MCIKYTVQRDPPDIKWPERGTDKKIRSSFMKCGGNNEGLHHLKILIEIHHVKI